MAQLHLAVNLEPPWASPKTWRSCFVDWETFLPFGSVFSLLRAP